MRASCSCCSGWGCGCGVVLVVDTSGPGVVGVGEGLSAGGDGKGDAVDTGVSIHAKIRNKIGLDKKDLFLFFGPSVFASSIVNIIFLVPEPIPVAPSTPSSGSDTPQSTHSANQTK